MSDITVLPTFFIPLYRTYLCFTSRQHKAENLAHALPYCWPFRCPLAPRAASGSGTRPCHAPSANAAAVFPPCGVWTPPPRGRRRGTLPSIRQASGCDADRAALFGIPRVIYWSLLQVFVDGTEPAKKPLARMFEDSASEKSVRAPISSIYICSCWNLDLTPCQLCPILNFACPTKSLEQHQTWGMGHFHL